MAPLVSVLIPCFNAERWVAQAVESALAQTWPEKEIIVIDDGSTDRSLEVIRQFDGRIHWESGPNRGSNAARNRLLELARGEWLQYLDADDYLLPEKLARQVAFVLKDPNCDVVYSPVAWERIQNGTRVCTETPILEPRDPWSLLAAWKLPQTGGTLWRRAVLDSVGGWRVGQSCCQEHELYCRLLEAEARFKYCAGCLAVYRDVDDEGRVTRRQKRELVRQRLTILERIESHLEERSLLTPVRHQAVNDARHELARSLWESHRQQAKNTYQRILASDPSFVPTVTSSSQMLYLIVYRCLGFRAAQIAASLKRALRPRSANCD
jgi:glycosyltransferase involved in cell wall biosynthesis